MSAPTTTTPELAYGLEYTDDARKAWRLDLLELERRHMERGCRLARAMRGEQGAERGVYFLTPARAEKWQKLYEAGFDARAWRDDGWRFVHRRWPHAVSLPVALHLARAMRVVNQALSQPLPAHPETIHPRGTVNCSDEPRATCQAQSNPNENTQPAV